MSSSARWSSGSRISYHYSNFHLPRARPTRDNVVFTTTVGPPLVNNRRSWWIELPANKSSMPYHKKRQFVLYFCQGRRCILLTPARRSSGCSFKTAFRSTTSWRFRIVTHNSNFLKKFNPSPIAATSKISSLFLVPIQSSKSTHKIFRLKTLLYHISILPLP